MAKKEDDDKKPKGKNGKKGKGKTPTYDSKKRYDELNLRLSQYAGVVDSLYDDLEREMANLAISTGYTTTAATASKRALFRLASFPVAFQRFKSLLSTYLTGVSFVIDRGTRAEWEKAESDHDSMTEEVLRQYYGETPHLQLEGYMTHKTDARDAFLKQQRDGKHGWSARVWNLQDQVQQEMELSVSAAVADGTSASSLAAKMKQYLNEPDRLFRRVRNEFGELELSKNAAAYHPGPGIYRSSRANAMRLCRTEINMAYRNADQERYQSEDFVVGYEIRLSGAHPKPDICDILAGKYPKTFKWSGWHPHDLCFITPILKTEDEFFNPTNEPSKNEVTEPPAAYLQYMADNADRMEAARQRGTLPYWVTDNYRIDQNGGFRPLFFSQPGAERVHSDHINVDVQTDGDKNKEGITPQQYEANKKQYEALLKDSNYKDVEFNPETGGLKATHKEHNLDKKKGWYEQRAQQIGYENGHSVLLEKEDHTKLNVKNTEGTWDGVKFEIAAAETGSPNNIQRALKHCAAKHNAEVAVIFMPNYNESYDIEKALNKFAGLRKLNDGQWRKFEQIYFLSRDEIIQKYRQP